MFEIPKLIFDPIEHSIDDRGVAWTQYMGAVHTAIALETPARELSTRATSWVVDKLVFAHAFFDAQTMTNNSSGAAPPNAQGFLLGWVYRKGCTQIWHDGDLFDIGDDVICLFDYSREVHSISSDSEVVSFVVPHASIGYDPKKHPSRIILDRQSGDGAWLNDRLDQMLSRLDTMKRKDAPEAAEEFAATLSALINRNVDAKDQTLSLDQEIRANFDELIFDPSLTVESLMNASEVSRGRVYEALNSTGDMRERIIKRRLDYAFRSLAFGDVCTKRMKDIAALCLFDDEAQFRAAFQRQFSIGPEIVMGVLHNAVPVPEPSSSQRVWETWFNAGQDCVNQ